MVTQDSWSFQPGGTVGSAGGETGFSFAIEETNFLGRGKGLKLIYGSDAERTSMGVRYRDPNAFGRYWQLESLYLENSDGTQLELEVERPFYSFATPWAVTSLVSDRRFSERPNSHLLTGAISRGLGDSGRRGLQCFQRKSF